MADEPPAPPEPIRRTLTKHQIQSGRVEEITGDSAVVVNSWTTEIS
jgi:hypothetical protein